jgi:hypothetical protein
MFNVSNKEKGQESGGGLCLPSFASVLFKNILILPPQTGNTADSVDFRGNTSIPASSLKGAKSRGQKTLQKTSTACS